MFLFALLRRVAIFVFLIGDDMREYMIYCDESLSKGRYYSHFYGGVLVKSKEFYRVNTVLEEMKTKLNLLNPEVFYHINKLLSELHILRVLYN